MLITSAATVQPLSAASNAVATDVEGLLVAVVKTSHAKCVRCWHHTTDIGVNAQHPELCGRCVENVDGSGELRRYA